jgi:hypothetical protein
VRDVQTRAGVLGDCGTAVRETVNATKVCYGEDEALALLCGIEKLIAAKGACESFACIGLRREPRKFRKTLNNEIRWVPLQAMGSTGLWALGLVSRRTHQTHVLPLPEVRRVPLRERE